MPWKWMPMKGSYQQVPYPESESVSAQIKAPQLWKKNDIEDDGFITVHPNLEPMEVEEGSITFPKD